MGYYLGADVGGSKTDVVIVDHQGHVLGAGKGGPGNPQGVGFEGLFFTLNTALQQALSQAGITAGHIEGAGFGIGGYDWPTALPKMLAVTDRLGFGGQSHIVNDAILGLVAGARNGWGISIVSGTGCNCRGWDETHQREGRVTGFGSMMGEGAGASELVQHAMIAVSYAWSKRGQPTTLCDAFVSHAGARDLEDLIEGYTEERYHVGASAAPLIFAAADAGDAVAQGLCRWAGQELGEMANAVGRQLGFGNKDVDVVLVGSMFRNGGIMLQSLRQTIAPVLPGAKLVQLRVQPVAGAALIGMEQAGLLVTAEIRAKMAKSLPGHAYDQD